MGLMPLHAHRGITALNMGDQERGMRLLREAQAVKALDEHEVIEDAIRDRGEGYSVFCIVSDVRAADDLGLMLEPTT